MESTAHVSRDLARLMLMMRRLIKEEFTVTVHLDEPDAVEELLAFAGRARSSLLRGMGRELEALAGADTAAPEMGSGHGEPGLPESDAAIDAATPAAGCYRGAPVRPASQPDTPRKSPGTRIYRGRVVE